MTVRSDAPLRFPDEGAGAEVGPNLLKGLIELQGLPGPAVALGGAARTLAFEIVVVSGSRIGGGAGKGSEQLHGRILDVGTVGPRPRPLH